MGELMKLIMLSGLPGSGKTTWCKDFISKNPEAVRVSRDAFRYMRGKYWVPSQENMITEWERNCVREALCAGYTVLCDATNLNPKTVKYWKALASKLNASFEEKFFDTPLEECIKRDNERVEGKVGEDVIRWMYNRYLKDKVEFPLFAWDVTLPHAILCDLDGTLALHNGRGPFDLDKCDTDLVNVPIKKIIEAYSGRVIFMSGREDICREKTLKWLQTNVPVLRYPEPLLYMRTTGDKRGDDIVKHELFTENILNKYYIDFVLDDRDKVVAMWRKIGLTCLQVNYGDF